MNFLIISGRSVLEAEFLNMFNNSVLLAFRLNLNEMSFYVD